MVLEDMVVQEEVTASTLTKIGGECELVGGLRERARGDGRGKAKGAEGILIPSSVGSAASWTWLGPSTHGGHTRRPSVVR